MIEDKYSMNRFFLQFYDKDTEFKYKDHIFERTLWFCRIAWGLVIILGGSFGLLDRQVFGEDAGLVLLVRLMLISFSALIIAVTMSQRFKDLMDLSSSLFILSVGPFCTFLMVMSEPSSFSPYFIGLLFAFTGVLSTAGMGFKYSLFGLLINLVFFEIAIGYFTPVSPMIFVLYNFFLVSILLVFGYIGYFIEVISRKNYIVSAQLYESLSQVKKLSGLLPICASCKNVRDDQGYWKQIETYIQEHSEVDFSHGICPECVKKLYPQMDACAG